MKTEPSSCRHTAVPKRSRTRASRRLRALELGDVGAQPITFFLVPRGVRCVHTGHGGPACGLVKLAWQRSCCYHMKACAILEPLKFSLLRSSRRFYRRGTNRGHWRGTRAGNKELQAGLEGRE